MTSGNALDHPDSDWNRAVDASQHAEPFCCRSEWQLSFHEAFEPDRQLHLQCQDGSMLALAERQHDGVGAVFEPVESHWLFPCPLLGNNAVAMLAELLAGRPRVPAIIGGLQIGSNALQEFVETFHGSHDILQLASNVTCRASLAGGLDGYLSRRSAKTRRGVRSAARRIAAQGVSFERHAPTTTAETDAIYERILAVERASWKGIGECGMAEPPSSDFYRILLRRLAQSRASRVILARHEGRDIGFIFGGLCIDVGSKRCARGSIYRGQQFSFADDWRQASLGNVLQLEKVRWLCEEDVARYDMGPVMEYKHHWTETQTQFETLALRP